MRDAVIVDAVRTPMGRGGALSGVQPVDLHAHAIRSFVERTGIDPSLVLEQHGGRFGVQTMCEAGGLANATIVERL